MDNWYHYGTELVLIRTGMPQDAIQVGFGETREEAEENLETTPINSAGRDPAGRCVGWLRGEGWIESDAELDLVDE